MMPQTAYSRASTVCIPNITAPLNAGKLLGFEKRMVPRRSTVNAPDARHDNPVSPFQPRSSTTFRSHVRYLRRWAIDS
ncbi:hypothetical protein PgNI_11108 [Pyricularia grisea]|uniref:Uncharacterized protein n=1 Tax=Pyricularia grisea TaxID=148305 RepID=A0A6P8AYQ4_PYRGI|nr:hypothetical protein PgNI_11108 [Pyricularia grisea]TLD07465.1 hypothetical protein PgNI_11108 [Pyricularia grisea]